MSNIKFPVNLRFTLEEGSQLTRAYSEFVKQSKAPIPVTFQSFLANHLRVTIVDVQRKKDRELLAANHSKDAR